MHSDSLNGFYNKFSPRTLFWSRRNYSRTDLIVFGANSATGKSSLPDGFILGRTHSRGEVVRAAHLLSYLFLVLLLQRFSLSNRTSVLPILQNRLGLGLWRRLVLLNSDFVH